MKTLHYSRAHNLSKLADELLTGVPSLQPVANANGLRVASCIIEGDGAEVRLTVPDDVDETAVAAIIAKHDSTPIPEPPTPDDVLVTALTAATTLPQLKAALLNWAQAKRGNPV